MRWESLRMLQHIRIATSAFALQCNIYINCDLYAWNAMFLLLISSLYYSFEFNKQFLRRPTLCGVSLACVCVRVSFSKILCKFCLVLTLTQITEIALIFSLNVYTLKKIKKKWKINIYQWHCSYRYFHWNGTQTWNSYALTINDCFVLAAPTHRQAEFIALFLLLL